MSDNKTVPNAAAILNKARVKNDAPHSMEYWNAAIEAMHEHTRLHLEAMRDMLIEGLSTDKSYLYDKATDYIDKNKIL